MSISILYVFSMGLQCIIACVYYNIAIRGV
nr:MAG TPA: hypothetical protein [Caudoviricetes sp.]